MTSLAHTLDHPASHDWSWRTAALSTDGSATQALLRLTLGIVLFPHGAQHLLGWFGGYGFSGTVGWMQATLGIPPALAAAGILLEFVGPIALVLGIGSRLAGLSLAIFMAVAASTHLQHGFFMNWFGNQPAGVEGFEFHLLAIALAVAVAIRGGGAFALDRVLSARQTRR